MKNLGCYILPQVFFNIMLKYYPNDNIQRINTGEIIKDLNKDVEFVDNHIDYHRGYEQWMLGLEIRNEGNKRLIWNKNGKYLGLF